MGDILLTTDLVGTIEPADIVYIYPKAGGDVTAVNVKAGDVVAAGQVAVRDRYKTGGYIQKLHGRGKGGMG